MNLVQFCKRFADLFLHARIDFEKYVCLNCHLYRLN
jgi:hypothetical protein